MKRFFAILLFFVLCITCSNGFAATKGEENALAAANSYLSFMAFSYKGLIKQLEYEGYTSAESKYAADKCGANWYTQAARCAQNYLTIMSFSKKGLVEQLEYEGFTKAEAEYGASVAYGDNTTQPNNYKPTPTKTPIAVLPSPSPTPKRNEVYAELSGQIESLVEEFPLDCLQLITNLESNRHYNMVDFRWDTPERIIAFFEQAKVLSADEQDLLILNLSRYVYYQLKDSTVLTEFVAMITPSPIPTSTPKPVPTLRTSHTITKNQTLTIDDYLYIEPISFKTSQYIEAENASIYSGTGITRIEKRMVVCTIRIRNLTKDSIVLNNTIQNAIYTNGSGKATEAKIIAEDTSRQSLIEDVFELEPLTDYYIHVYCNPPQQDLKLRAPAKMTINIYDLYDPSNTVEVTIRY